MCCLLCLLLQIILHSPLRITFSCSGVVAVGVVVVVVVVVIVVVVVVVVVVY